MTIFILVGLAVCILLAVIIYKAAQLTQSAWKREIELRSFSLSEDGRQMILTLNIMGGAGCVSAVETEEENGKLYAAFDIDSSGERKLEEVTLTLPDGCHSVYLYNGDGVYGLALRRDENGEWKDMRTEYIYEYEEQDEVDDDELDVDEDL